MSYYVENKKYNIFAHPNFKRTEDGGYPAYEHNKIKETLPGITALRIPLSQAKEISVPDLGYELYAEFELQEQFDI